MKLQHKNYVLQCDVCIFGFEKYLISTIIKKMQFNELFDLG